MTTDYRSVPRLLVEVDRLNLAEGGDYRAKDSNCILPEVEVEVNNLVNCLKLRRRLFLAVVVKM